MYTFTTLFLLGRYTDVVGTEFLSEDSLQSLTLLEPQVVGLGDACAEAK